MATRRVLRTVRPAEHGAFDEQLWPINSLLIVFCGAVAGLIIGTSDFRTPVWWLNGWVRLATLFASVLFLLLAANYLGGARGRRFQLAALLSLIVHFFVGVGLWTSYVNSTAPPADDAVVAIKPEVIQYEYFVRTIDQQAPPEAHEQPVPTDTPPDQPVDLSRPVEQQPLEQKPQPTPLPEPKPPLEPSPVPMQRREVAAAKSAAAESLLSRSAAQANLSASAPLTAPEMPSTADAATGPQERVTAVSRQPSETSQQKPASENDSTADPRVVATTPERSRAEQQPTAEQASSTLARSVSRPNVLPPADQQEPSMTAKVESDPRSEFSAAPLPTRQTTTAPTLAQPMVEPSPAVTAPTVPVPATRVAATPVADVPTEPTSLARSSTQSAADSNAQSNAIAIQRSAVDSADVAASIGPTSVELTRTDLRPAIEAAIRPASADESANARAQPSVAIAAPSRKTSESPSLTGSAAANAPSRATGTSVTAPSSQVESPSVAASGNQDSTPLETSRSALSRSTAGSAGVGRSENLDFDVAAASAPALSAAASRSAASTSVNDPTTLPGTGNAALSRSVSGPSLPSAVARDESPDVADEHGGLRVARVDTDSGAGLARRAGEGLKADRAAIAGTSSADTGAPRVVVSAGGAGRGDGGGQPAVAMTSQAPQPTRNQAGGVPLNALAADTPAPGDSASTSADPGNAQSDPPGNPEVAVARSAAASLAGRPSDDLKEAGLVTPVGGSIGAAARLNRDEAGPASFAAGDAARVPGRSVASPAAADSQADEVQLASIPQPDGAATGSPLTPNKSAGERRPLGLPNGKLSPDVGAIAGDIRVAASALGAGTAARPSPTEANSAGPAAHVEAAGSSLARSQSVAGPGLESAIQAPELATGQTEANSASQPAGAIAAPTKRSGGVPVEIAALDGPGGLGAEFSPAVGSLRPQAQRDSTLIHDEPSRFLRRNVSGAPPVAGFIRDAAKGFERRGSPNGLGQGRQNSKTEEAIERGLDFLVRCQQPNGSWSFQKYPGATPGDLPMIQSDTAATGLAMLTFLGAGYDHFEDKHKESVRRGLKYLVEVQRENGDLYVPQEAESHKSAWLYSHAIASIALCEAFGMTGDESLRAPAQKALDFIAAAQDLKYGGWRYRPGEESDTSVSGWQLMALKSGELAGLSVKKETYDAVENWLKAAQATGTRSTQFVYSPYVSEAKNPAGRRPSRAMTAVGLLMRMYMGWDRTNPELVAGADYLRDNLPQFGFAANPARDTYYWYYATQVMFHMKGDYWKQWNGALYPLLIGSQVSAGPTAGSWDPAGRIPDRWAGQGGRIYVTTLNLLSLEVYYRHLPIYESTAK